MSNRLPDIEWIYLDIIEGKFILNNPNDYLKNNPNSRIVEVQVNKEIVDSFNLDPEDLPLYIKKNGQMYKMEVQPGRQGLKMNNIKSPESSIFLVSESHEVISYSFGSGSTYFVSTTSHIFTAVAALPFDGVGRFPQPTHIDVVLSQTGTEGACRIYDLTNNLVIGSINFTGGSSPEIITIYPLSNVPEEPAVWELQLQRIAAPGNREVRAHSMHIYFKARPEPDEI